MYLSLCLEYDSAVVTSPRYFIGASFNDTFMTWKWINGSVVDQSFLSNYAVDDFTDTCLAWDYLPNLSEFPCSLKLPYLCEIPI